MMREVKAQPIWANERALLTDMIAKHGSERGVEQMRSGVIALCGPP